MFILCRGVSVSVSKGQQLGDSSQEGFWILSTAQFYSAFLFQKVFLLVQVEGIYRDLCSQQTNAIEWHDMYFWIQCDIHTIDGQNLAPKDTAHVDNDLRESAGASRYRHLFGKESAYIHRCPD